MKFSLAVVASMAAGAFATGYSLEPTKTLVTYVTTTVCPVTTTQNSSVITTLTTSTLTITTCAGGCGGSTTTGAPAPPPAPPVSSMPPAASSIPTTQKPTSTRPFPSTSATVVPGAAPTNGIAGGALLAGALVLLGAF